MTAEIFKILALCLVAAILCIILRAKAPEYALSVSVAAGVIICIFLFGKLAAPIREIRDGLTQYGVKLEYFKIALKALGIGYITSFISDACRDAGQVSLASKAELAGKCAIFILSVPLIMAVLETAVGFLK